MQPSPLLRILALAALTAALVSAVLVVSSPLAIVRGPAPPPRISAEAPQPAPEPTPTPTPAADRPRPAARPPSVALGTPDDGRLVRGVRLGARGSGWITWDPILSRRPNRAWRRHGTDRLVALLERVARRWARTHPGAAPLVIGDLSRPRGGDFGPRYGIIGHATHQNGRDADVSYPRGDGRARPPRGFAEADPVRSRALVRAFVAAGAELVYVTPALGPIAGPVTPVGGHEGHLHVRVGG